MSERVVPVAATSLARIGLAFARLLDRFAERRRTRLYLLVIAEVLIAAASTVGAVAIVFSGEFWRWPRAALFGIVLVALGHLLVGWLSGAVRTRWRFVGIHDALVILRACVISGVLAAIVLAAIGMHLTAARLVAAYLLLYLSLAGGLRLLARSFHEWGRRAQKCASSERRRAVVIGGGLAGATLIKTLLASPRQLIDPVAIVDDSPGNRGKLLHGVPIVGRLDELAVIAQSFAADELLIAIPSATAEQMRRIVDLCLKTRRPFRIAPDPEGAGLRSSPLRVIQFDDLLGRPAVKLNLAQMRAELSGARIVVTGAAGSIGSELVRQLVKLQPAHLFLVDRNENDMYYLAGDLAAKDAGVPYTVQIEDIRSADRMRRFMQQVQPTHVFHAAAFKHVPLMELHPLSAVENNILGTWSVLEAAGAARARKFVLISTDKAVEPSSVMGATKRFAEMLVSEFTANGPMAGVIVRFGNVLGSNGSVVPLFQRQIAAGGPVTVTSFEATRYFMTVPEAAQLVLQASSLEETTGKIAILDMGTPVRIAELAERLVTLSGLRPGVDIEIAETGLRPGEKLHESLWWGSEKAEPSSHPTIQLAPAKAVPAAAGGSALELIPEVFMLVDREDRVGLRTMLERTTGLRSENGGQGPAQGAGVVYEAHLLSPVPRNRPSREREVPARFVPTG
ncbi:MAG: hypothetical protein A2085_02045 [Gemmatimonadetes bacterium GWC2_71_10]|nr:MAG: hypothetical protein A2085_02045 [Gemmatimonadetes bacterium GWC2_71_10]